MAGNVHQSDSGKLKAKVYQTSPAGLLCEPRQFISAYLKATVTQHEKDRTITGTATVTPSGDMARKHPWDRNASAISEYYGAAAAAHAYTVRWTYTIPTDKIYNNGTMLLGTSSAIATATKYASQVIEMSFDAGDTYLLVGWNVHESTTSIALVETTPALFSLFEDNIIRGKTFHDDTVNHGQYVAITGLEFDV